MVSVTMTCRILCIFGLAAGSLTGTGCAGTRQLNQISTLSNASDTTTATNLLYSDHRYIRLATLDKIQATPPSDSMQKGLIDPLLHMLYDEEEWCPIRGRSARILGEWQQTSATEGIIEAMETCDDESRYWMLLGLQPLSSVDPIALGAIQSLTYDTDIFIRTEASSWLEAR